MPFTSRIVRYFLIAGFLVPCLLLLVIYIGKVEVGGTWTWLLLIPWPTFLFMMSAEADPGGFGFVIAFLISAASNVIVYGIVGWVVSFCYRRLVLRSVRFPSS